ncbi:NXPE family member 1-like [Ambystoma mexicanum]|uniref:NXPE family member 1-like n=1 Tax=Ambystoma mexicanum TaxID=8296 RepID=UPI0037E9B058
MVRRMKTRYKACLVLALFGIALFGYSIHQRHLELHTIFCQVSSVPESLENLDNSSEIQLGTGMVLPKGYLPFVEPLPMKADWNDTEEQIQLILSEIEQVIPKVTFTHMDNTTCIEKSRASIVNPKERYGTGDKVTVQLDMHDYLGNRKKYGGDLLRARIYSTDLGAGASGKISDFQNGTYHVEFTLFWAGKVKISLLLIHPSEAVVALWRVKNTGYDLISHQGRYTSPTESIDTRCSYDLDTKDEVCELMAKKGEYPFYCIKPPHMPCASLTMLGSFFTMNTHLTDLEKASL